MFSCTFQLAARSGLGGKKEDLDRFSIQQSHFVGFLPVCGSAALIKADFTEMLCCVSSCCASAVLTVFEQLALAKCDALDRDTIFPDFLWAQGTMPQ